MIALCVGVAHAALRRSHTRKMVLFAAFSSSRGNSNIDIASYVLPTNATHPQLATLRHSTAHVLAMAVQRLNPECKVALGPCTENGYTSHRVLFAIISLVVSIMTSTFQRNSSLTAI